MGAEQIEAPAARAWHAFIDAQASLLRRLEADLLAEAQLTLAEYDVLVQLEAAPQSRLRMAELSDRVRISRSGLTRLLDRLVEGGLVERQTCPSDRRGSFASLTETGEARLGKARPIHERGIREYFSDRLTAPQMEAIAAALGPLGATLPRPGRPPMA